MWRVGIDSTRAEAAHQPQRRLLTFEIAAKPEEIVGRAARQVAEHADDAHSFRGGQQARRLDGAVRPYPDVGRFDASGHGDGARVALVGDAGESAGHDAPSLRRRGGVDAKDEWARNQPAMLPARHRRKAHDVLTDVIDAARLDRRAKPRALSRIEF